MRLIHAHIENFGMLSNADFDFEPGLNVILRDNGEGKSTLAAFIRVMFYGFDNERGRSELENQRRRYAPWQGGIYGGSLKFETGGRTYILNRTFGKAAKSDSFSLSDAETLLESRDFSANIGQELFGIDTASFQRTVFISQNDCETSPTAGISAKLGGLDELSGDMGRYDRAQETLKGILNGLSPSRSTGSVNRLKKEISALEADLRYSGDLDRQLDEKAAALKQAGSEQAELKRRQSALRERQDRANELNVRLDLREKYDSIKLELEGRTAEAEKARNALDGCSEDDIENRIAEIDRAIELCDERGKLIAEAAALKDELHRQEAAKSGGKPIIPLMAAGLALLLAGFVMAGLGISAGFICSAVGLAMAAAAFGPMLLKTGGGSHDGLKNELNEKEAAAADIENRLRDFAAAAGVDPAPEGLAGRLYKSRSCLEKLFGDLRHATEELEAVQITLNNFEAENDAAELLAADPSQRVEIGELITELRKVDGEINAVNERLGGLGRELEDLRLRRDSLSAEAEELAEKRRQLAADEKSFRLLNETADMLARAREKLTVRYMKPLKDGFDKYYSMISGAEGNAFDLDAEMNLSVREAGQARDPRMLSQGRKDLVYLCQRMAMVDAMYQAEKPFVLLDDPFVNLDGARIEGGLKFLDEAAKEYQLIYFTCHESRTLNKNKRSTL